MIDRRLKLEKNTGSGTLRSWEAEPTGGSRNTDRNWPRDIVKIISDLKSELFARSLRVFDIPRCLRRWLLEVFSIKSIQNVLITTPISTCSVPSLSRHSRDGYAWYLAFSRPANSTQATASRNMRTVLEPYPSGRRDVIACVADRAAWLLVTV